MIQIQEIETLFKKQLDKIQNHKLRQNVVKTWVKACEHGKWETIDELEKIPFSLIVETHGINIIEHTIAVTESAAAIGHAQMVACRGLPYTINFDRLYAGSLLHDVGKLLEIEPDGSGGYQKSRSGKLARHPVSGAILAAECGIPEDIRNTIICHSTEGEGNPQVVESIFIHQADFALFNPFMMKQNGLLIEC